MLVMFALNALTLLLTIPDEQALVASPPENPGAPSPKVVDEVKGPRSEDRGSRSLDGPGHSLYSAMTEGCAKAEAGIRRPSRWAPGLRGASGATGC